MKQNWKICELFDERGIQFDGIKFIIAVIKEINEIWLWNQNECFLCWAPQ